MADELDAAAVLKFLRSELGQDVDQDDPLFLYGSVVYAALVQVQTSAMTPALQALRENAEKALALKEPMIATVEALEKIQTAVVRIERAATTISAIVPAGALVSSRSAYMAAMIGSGVVGALFGVASIILMQVLSS